MPGAYQKLPETIFLFLILCRIRAELLKNDSSDVDMDAASKITAQDFLDAANEEMAQFKLADIVTGN